ncbi:MAG: serine/threonine-protein kinase [Verrucomicrobiota bacterium]
MSDRYEILGKLGQGGIGAVYRARDTVLEREVAIKRLLPQDEKPEEAQKTGEYLIKEAGMLSKLQHPNIVNVFEAATDDDGAYIVMEFIDGDTLDKAIVDGPLNVQEFISVMEQALEALIAAQEIGMMHRDLKPTNVMLKKRTSGKYDLKVLDFGLAKISASPALQTIDHGNSILGSIYFMAPEQFEHVPLDGRTDLYALGCLGYFGLTREYPFQGETAAHVMDAHLDHRLTDIRELRPELPEPLAAWLMRMISLSVDNRPENAKAALSELDAIVQGLPREALDETQPTGTTPKLITGQAAIVAAAEHAATSPNALSTMQRTTGAIRPPGKKPATPWMTPVIVAATLIVGGILALILIDGSRANATSNVTRENSNEKTDGVNPVPGTVSWINEDGDYLPHPMTNSRPLVHSPLGGFKWGMDKPVAELIPLGSKWRQMPVNWNKFPNNWTKPDFKEKNWNLTKAPIGRSNGEYYTEGTILHRLPKPAEGEAIGPMLVRANFKLEESDTTGPLEVHLRADDGAVIYVNGREVRRVGLPFGPLARSAPTIRDINWLSTTRYNILRVDAAQLQAGRNTIAFRIHSRGPADTDPDIGFDAAVYLMPHGTKVNPPHDFLHVSNEEMIVPPSRKNGRPWKYTEEVEPLKKWENIQFNDKQWTEGQAPFGAKLTNDQPDINTELIGSNLYLRRKFTLSADQVEKIDQFAFVIRTNVNATISINGRYAIELKNSLYGRYGFVEMPQYVKKKLVEGENVIAVHLGSKKENPFFDLGIGLAPKS